MVHIDGGRSAASSGRRPGRLVLEPVRPFHLSGRFDDQLDAVGALVVDATAAHGLGEIVQHGPRHAGQVAQVTVLSLTHLHGANLTATARVAVVGASGNVTRGVGERGARLRVLFTCVTDYRGVGTYVVVVVDDGGRTGKNPYEIIM